MNVQLIEITERKCADGVQPNIQVGKRYYVKSTEKMKDGTKVLVLYTTNEDGIKSKTMRCNEGRFGWRTFTPEEVREEAVRGATKHDTKVLSENFSFDEQMQIAFIPLIIIGCAWKYADKVLDECVANRIETTKKLCRAVRMLHQEYNSEVMQELDYRHRANLTERSDFFFETHLQDFTIMEMTIRNEILKTTPDDPYLAMRSYAFIAMILCDYYVLQMHRSDELIARRMRKKETPSAANPKITALRSCMDAFTGTVKIDLKHNVDLCVKIFANNLKRIEFTLDK